MRGPGLPRDSRGFAYQVVLILIPGGGGTKDLKRDDRGRVLAWAQPGRRPAGGPSGKPAMEPVPPEVQREAEMWLAQQRDPTYVPTPWWKPGDHIICADACGRDLDPRQAVPHIVGKSIWPICPRCQSAREELDRILSEADDGDRDT